MARFPRPTCGLPALVLAIACATAGALVWAEEPKQAKPAADEAFRSQVEPFVRKYCYECHGAKKQQADIALNRYTDPKAIDNDAGTWERVLEMLRFEAMPPEDRPQPSADERQRVVAWLEARLFPADCNLEDDPGRVTIRRLNRAEYNNTIRDLLGVDINPARDFPSDDVGYGFDNIGDVLSLPPLLMEKYLGAAERIAQTAIIVRTAADAPRQVRDGRRLKTDTAVRGDGVWTLASQGEVFAEFEFPRNGEYLLRVEANADQAGNEPARMELRLGDQKLRVFDVEADANTQGLREYELRTKVTAGRKRFSAAFINDYYQPEHPDPRQRGDRNLHVGALLVIGPLDVAEDELPESHRRLVRAKPGEGKSVPQAAREVLAPFITRAFRRPAQTEEVERFVRLVELAVERGESYERGLQLAVTGVLVSPHFLFRIERDPAPHNPQAVHPLSDYELATRLSYFLWSSMPDEELFRLAAEGVLQRDEVLAGQVKRMLADPKSQALVENFGGQWLNLRLLEETSPDPQRFETFSLELRADMRRETELFFAAVMREDRSILDFLEGDFTFVNGRLARHYGIAGVEGREFRRLSLAGTPRAGVLTHASILTLTSNPTRTSPVKRGKWILENILGTPPPDPPAGVPELEAAQRAAPDATLREQLELHRKDPTCASCHRQMDALGFGFENFDPIGRWRERDGRAPIDASGALPGGESFRGPRDLVTILGRRKAEFSRALAGKMLTYALGRGPTAADRCTVDDVAEALEAHDYRFSALVTTIVLSEPFRMRRGEGGTR